MAVASPRVLELRPAGHQQHHTPMPDRLDHRIKQFARRRVDPVRVFQKDQHGSLLRKREQPIREHLQGPHLA